MEIYYLSVGRGVNLLLNITPDDHGEIPPAQIRRLREFGDEITARFAKPLAAAKGNAATLELDLGDPKSVDHLRLREEIRQGERVRRFRVEGRGVDGAWRTLYRGTQIGARQIIPIPAVTLSSLRLRVEHSMGEPVIREFAAFYVNRPAPKSAYRRND